METTIIKLNIDDWSKVLSVTSFFKRSEWRYFETIPSRNRVLKDNTVIVLNVKHKQGLRLLKLLDVEYIKL